MLESLDFLINKNEFCVCLTLALPDTRIFINFSTVYNDTLVAKGLINIILLVLLAMFWQRTINYYPRTILMQGRRVVDVHWKAERNSLETCLECSDWGCLPCWWVQAVPDGRHGEAEAATGSSWFPEWNSKKMLSLWPQVPWIELNLIHLRDAAYKSTSGAIQRIKKKSSLWWRCVVVQQTVEIGNFAHWMWWKRSWASVAVWAMVLSWNSKLLEAQLARDRSEHVAVCWYSPLKFRTGVSCNSPAEKWWDRGRSSW